CQAELVIQCMHSRGVEHQRDLVQVQVHHPTSNGGIRIDAWGQATLPGLFAVGEAAGWQGADRLGGTMLGGSQVFGWRAGRKAAEVACRRSATNVSATTVEPLLEPLARMREARGRHRPDDLRPALQRVMWECLIVEED